MDGRTAICRQCADLETAQVYSGGDHSCLWFDDRLGVVQLVEGEPAYTALFPVKTDREWGRHYVHETNDRLGRGPATVSRIVVGWMAA
ncbi:hypothetical protein H7J07_04695 [Mycobacterium koreense]|nr:hypothetical protein [Mycolicibacillus koreensis]MCV7247555.1 hypothetical protein [Mycolicibacillus koreensis]BBY53934.1 hypothetical protein MKOR_11850 [Mycolicibacillus koreensis]